MASDPEHILQSNTNPSFRTAYMNDGYEEHEVQEPVETLEHAFAIDDDGSPSPPALESAPAISPARSGTELLVSAELRAAMGQIAREESERLHASQVQASMTQPAEETLSNIFQTGFE